MPLSTSLRPSRPNRLREALAHEAPPVRVHRELRGRVRDDRRRPLDRVDLRDQRRVHEPRAVEEVVVRPGRVLLAQRVADRVVLEREERVQDAEPDPEVRRDALEVDVLGQVGGEEALLVDAQLAALARRGSPARSPRRCRRSASRPTSGCRPSRRSAASTGRRRRSGRAACAGSRIGPLRARCRARRAATSQGRSVSFLPWLNQSCTSNWSQAPASRLSVVAGMKRSRVSSSRLTSARVRLEDVRRLAAGTCGRPARCARSARRSRPSAGSSGRCRCRRACGRGGSARGRSPGGGGGVCTVSVS